MQAIHLISSMYFNMSAVTVSIHSSTFQQRLSPAGCSHLSLGPLALILGSGFWQPHPLSYRLASTQCPRSSFSNTMHSPAVHLPFSITLFHTPLLSIPHFSSPLIHLLPSFNFLKLPPSTSLIAITLLYVSGNLVMTGGPTTGTVSCLIPVQGSMSGTSQGSQSHCSAKQRLCAPSFKPGPLRQLPLPRSHWQTARKTDGLCIHDQFSGSPGVTPIQGEGFCQLFHYKAFQSGRKLEMHFKIVP